MRIFLFYCSVIVSNRLMCTCIAGKALGFQSYRDLFAAKITLIGKHISTVTFRPLPMPFDVRFYNVLLILQA